MPQTSDASKRVISPQRTFSGQSSNRVDPDQNIELSVMRPEDVEYLETELNRLERELKRAEVDLSGKDYSVLINKRNELVAQLTAHRSQEEEKRQNQVLAQLAMTEPDIST